MTAVISPLNRSTREIPYEAYQNRPLPPKSLTEFQYIRTGSDNVHNPSKTDTMSVNAKQKIDWPPSVRLYVQRAFVPESAIPGISNEEMQTKLKRVITEATESGKLHLLDWANMPLPQQLLLDERNKEILAPSMMQYWPPPSTVSSFAQTPQSTKVDSSHKRKSSELTGKSDPPANQPPWRKADGPRSFADRITSPAPSDKRARIDSKGRDSSKSNASLEHRKKRFESSLAGSNSPRNGSSSRGDSPGPVKSGPVIGRSQKIEKNYFRLTSAPNPDTVRPLSVLRKSLEHLKKMWRQECNYTYTCDQFKSLRQDLTVQHIKNDFTVNVYEIHARIALEKGDLGEYNQCQTQLRALYKQKLGGHPSEFKAYRILYFIHTCNRTDMNDVLSDLTAADKQDPAVKHALDVRSALALKNYHRFFRLYLDCPNMGAYLMDMFVDRERLAALSSMCKAYKPELRIRFLTEELAFESDEQSARFILEHGPEDSPETILQERDGSVQLLTSKAFPYFEAAKTGAFKKVDIKGQI
ncbi:MAG: hypothetical protein Q9227_009020 [Pyrenula ochraceoflavens]